MDDGPDANGVSPADLGVQCLQEISRLRAADLADDDVVGSLAWRVPYQVTGRHAAAGEVACLEAQAV